MKGIIMLLLISQVVNAQVDSIPKNIRPLSIGDKVPNIPFNILKMGKTKDGRDTSWTEIQWLYDFLDGKDEYKPVDKPTGIVKGYIGVALPSKSPIVYIDSKRYYGDLADISPDTMRSVVVYKPNELVVDGKFPDAGVIAIETFENGKLPFYPEDYIPAKKSRKWWQFWKPKSKQ